MQDDSKENEAQSRTDDPATTLSYECIGSSVTALS